MEGGREVTREVIGVSTLILTGFDSTITAYFNIFPPVEFSSASEL